MQRCIECNLITTLLDILYIFILDRSLSNSNQKNLFGGSVPFKSSESTSDSDPSSSSFDPVKLVDLCSTNFKLCCNIISIYILCADRFFCENFFSLEIAFLQLQNVKSCSQPQHVRYLLNNHRDVTISDLQTGVNYLEVECGTHTSSDIEFVKTHIDVLLACHDTLQKVSK